MNLSLHTDKKLSMPELSFTFDIPEPIQETKPKVSIQILPKKSPKSKSATLF